jgi:uncharacterized protein
MPQSSALFRLLPLLGLPSASAAQAPPDVKMERAGYVAWLKTAPNSPLAAIAQQKIGDGLRLGPADADIPLPATGDYRIDPSGAGFVLDGPGGKRPIGREHPYRIGTYVLYLTGSPSGTVLTVFSDGPRKESPGYFDYDPAMVFKGPLVRPEHPEVVRVLGSDGIEAVATEVGSFVVQLGSASTSLRVLRIPVAGGDESDLEIFFRDGTNGHGTYPAGRFVSLIPMPGGRFRLDFNRAMNPYCAYSSAYACPLPWRGNVISAPVRAGERYAGEGLETPPTESKGR